MHMSVCMHAVRACTHVRARSVYLCLRMCVHASRHARTCAHTCHVPSGDKRNCPWLCARGVAARLAHNTQREAQQVSCVLVYIPPVNAACAADLLRRSLLKRGALHSTMAFLFAKMCSAFPGQQASVALTVSLLRSAASRAAFAAPRNGVVWWFLCLRGACGLYALDAYGKLTTTNNNLCPPPIPPSSFLLPCKAWVV